jgi:hypothetical protein
LLDIFHQRKTIGLGPRKRQTKHPTPEFAISGFRHSAQRDISRWLIEQASVALVYLGIVATFAAVSVIGCVIWLLIW